MSIEVVSVEVVVHASLKIDGKLVKVNFIDKGAGQIELTPESVAQDVEIPAYIMEQIHKQARLNRGTD